MVFAPSRLYRGPYGTRPSTTSVYNYILAVWTDAAPDRQHSKRESAALASGAQRGMHKCNLVSAPQLVLAIARAPNSLAALTGMPGVRPASGSPLAMARSSWQAAAMKVRDACDVDVDSMKVVGRVGRARDVL